jgi:hypothetical protein
MMLVVAVGKNTHTGIIKEKMKEEDENGGEGGCCGGDDEDDDEENAGAMQKKLLKLTVSLCGPYGRSASSFRAC